jgi:hypothetical protein
MAQCVEFLIATPTVTVNNVAFATVSDSVSFIDGQGTRNITGASAGGNAVCQIASIDVTDAVGTIKFSVHSTKNNIELLTQFNQNQFVARLAVEVTGTDNITGETLTRSMSGGTIMNNPEVKLGPGAQIDIEIQGRQLV